MKNMMFLHRATLFVPAYSHIRVKLAVKWEFFFNFCNIFVSLTLVRYWSRYAVGVYLAAELFLFLYLLRCFSLSNLLTCKILKNVTNFSVARLVEKKPPGDLTLKQWGKFSIFALPWALYAIRDPLWKAVLTVWDLHLTENVLLKAVLCFRYINMNLFEIRNSSIFHKFPSVDCQAIKEER